MLTPILILSAALQASESRPQVPADPGPEDARRIGTAKADPDASTPEQALRAFLVAMSTRDAATLRAVTLPTEDLDWLLKGKPLTAGQVDRMKAVIARQPIRALKPGDEFSLPGNRKGTVQPEEVGTDRAVLLPEGAPVPTRVWKLDGRWRVDATPIIAGRKAAEAARRKKANSAL